MPRPGSILPTSGRTRRLAAVTAVAALGAVAAVAAPADSDDAVVAASDEARPVLTHPSAPAEIASPPLSEQLIIQAAATDEVREAPAPEPAPEEEASPEPAAEAEPARNVWDALADCESGEWTGSGGFVEDSANWSATAGTFEGGLQFHPGTWDGFKDADMPAAAYDATRAQQITVAERVLEAQGWEAWPVCSRKLGLR